MSVENHLFEKTDNYNYCFLNVINLKYDAKIVFFKTIRKQLLLYPHIYLK